MDVAVFREFWSWMMKPAKDFVDPSANCKRARNRSWRDHPIVEVDMGVMEMWCRHCTRGLSPMWFWPPSSWYPELSTWDVKFWWLLDSLTLFPCSNGLAGENFTSTSNWSSGASASDFHVTFEWFCYFASQLERVARIFVWLYIYI